MKKMRIKNQEVNEALTGIKVAVGYALKFMAICLTIPAKLVLGIAEWMDCVAWKLTDLENRNIIVTSDRDIIAEITDM